MALPKRAPRREQQLQDSRDALRAAAEHYFGDREPIARVEDSYVHGPINVPIRLYHPNPGTALPVVVYAHGGGWVLGDRETHDRLCRALSAASGCAFVSVDYRRAPEHPFPAALEDVRQVLREVATNPEAFEINPTRLALAGDSAGGQLAAATALWARDNRIVVNHVALLMPDVDNRPESWPSHGEFDESYGLYPDDQIWYYEQYFGADWHAREGSGVSPLRAALTGFPPTTIVLAECDPVHDEGAAFAEALAGAGVDVELLEFAGMFHPFILFRELSDTRVAEQKVARSLRNSLLSTPLVE